MTHIINGDKFIYYGEVGDPAPLDWWIGGVFNHVEKHTPAGVVHFVRLPGTKLRKTANVYTFAQQYSLCDQWIVFGHDSNTVDILTLPIDHISWWTIKDYAEYKKNNP